MPTIAVTYINSAQRAKAEALALQLTLPLVTALETQFDYLLVFTEEKLELRPSGHKTMGAICVDFLTGPVAYRRAHGGGRGQLLARAVGIKAGIRPSIIDATAGFGRDAFVLASLGCSVLLLERSPIMGALLADGLLRAKSELTNISMELRIADAIEYLKELPQSAYPDVIYLDPMYPERHKTALVKKELRILRALVGDNMDAPMLLEVAMKIAKKRVVVKRPLTAAPILGPKVSVVFSSKASRFDVYLSRTK